LDQVNKTLDNERDDRLTKAFDDQAKTFNIGIEGLGSVLKDVAGKCEKATMDKLTAILKVASDKAGFVPVGKTASAETAGSTDVDGIYTEMTLTAKAAFPELKAAEAVTKFMGTSEGKESYNRYEKAKRLRARSAG
jgi:hypothetical protein